jgi:hypothetical protein
LVKNAASLISVGPENFMIEKGPKSLLGEAWTQAQKEAFLSVSMEARNQLAEAVPLASSAAGQVQTVRTEVISSNPGDRVTVRGASFTSHAEVVGMPKNLWVPILQGIGAISGFSCQGLTTVCSSTVSSQEPFLVLFIIVDRSKGLDFPIRS